MPSLDLNRVKQLTEYSFLELQASVLYQQRWNELDGPKVLQDLMDNQDLWTSFTMRHQYFETDPEGFMLGYLIDELWQQARWNCERPHGDTLYLYAANNQEETVSRLVEFGKEWSFDVVTVYDGNKALEECNMVGSSQPIPVCIEKIRLWLSIGGINRCFEIKPDRPSPQ